MKVAIYSRKSKFTGKGESIGNQIELCKDYCNINLQDKNITDFLIYEDEGFSGKNTDRPEFQKMLNNAKAKKFDFIICYRLDRISRNVADFSTLINKLQEYEIGFISIREQFDTSTPMGRAMMYIASVFAQLERETIAERIKDNMIELAKTGRWLGGQTPLGFKSEKIVYLDGESKEKSMHKLSPINDELKKVKLIYDKYIETGSISLTLKYLLSNNIKGKNGGDFAPMSINDIIRNPVYAKSNEFVFTYLKEKGMQVCGTPNGNGMLIYNKVRSDYHKKDISEWIATVSKHKGIIEPDKWLYVQRNLDKNSKKTNPRQGTSKKSLLSGVLKCALCGAPMRVSYGRPKKDGSERIYYYMCTMKAHSGKTRCSNPNVRGDQLEKVVISKLKKLNKETILKELELYKKNATDSPANNIQCEIKIKSEQMNTLLEKLSKTHNETTSEFIMSKIDELGAEIKKLEYKLNNVEIIKNENVKKKLNAEILINALNNFNNTFDTLQSINEKRNMIEILIDRISWNGIERTVDIHLWGSKKKPMSQYNKPFSCLAYSIATLPKGFNFRLSRELLYKLSDTDTMGIRIRKLRKIKNMTSKQLANIIGLTPEGVINYENNNAYPSSSIIFKLYKLFGDDILCDHYTKFITSNYRNTLKKWRVKMNFNKKQASKFLGISETAYLGWENGTVAIPKRYFYKIWNKIKEQ